MPKNSASVYCTHINLTQKQKKNEKRIKGEALDPLAAGLRVVDGVAG
jgi:hypothetical protein